jgi:hypothetical protein
MSAVSRDYIIVELKTACTKDEVRRFCKKHGVTLIEHNANGKKSLIKCPPHKRGALSADPAVARILPERKIPLPKRPRP